MNESTIVRAIMDKYNIPQAVAEAVAAESLRTAQAQKGLADRLKSRRSVRYDDWLQGERSDPDLNWDYQYVSYISSHLQALIDGDIYQLIVMCPPRTGKSSLITQRLPVYWMERNPSDGILLGAYSMDLAINFSNYARKLYGSRNPGEVESEAQREWTNVHGGYLKPVGVGVGVTGRGGDLCVHGDAQITTSIGSIDLRTLVRLPDKPLVLAFDHKAGAYVYRSVVATKASVREVMTEIETSGGRKIRVTGDHRVFTVEHGYRQAHLLRAGDAFIVEPRNLPGMRKEETSSQQASHVEYDTVAVVREIGGEGYDVYDIQVEGCNNFFAESILLHNCLIDDPVKSIEEALSPAYMERLWRWWTYDMKTRRNQMDLTPTCIVMTHWSDDDLVGRILNSSDASRWTVVSLPAIAEENDPLGRVIGESILPARMPLDSLLRYKADDPVMFSALFQQKPIQMSQASIKVDKFVFVDEVPRAAHRVRAWDMAATKGAGDFMVGLLLAVDDDGYTYVEDVVRGQWDEEEVGDQIALTAEMDWQKYGENGSYMMRTWLEQEPGSSGKIVASSFIRENLLGYDAYAERPYTNKSSRAKPFVSQVNAGNVRLKRGPWNAPYINELRVIVLGISNKRDDQLDASSLSFTKLVLERVRITIR